MTSPPYGPPPEQPGYGPQPTAPFAVPAGYGSGYGSGYGAPEQYGYQPGYGPGYQPGYGPGYGPVGNPGRRAANPAGIVLALVGGAAVLVGAFVDWYSDTLLGDIVNALDLDGAKAFPKAYFDWLMWVVLAATVVAALFANLPHSAAGALRVISPVLGVLGAVLVFASLSALIENGSVFDHSSGGLYLTLVGFLLAGAGGALGPRRTLS